MTLTDVLIEALKRTNGWVVVALFALFVAYEIYTKHKESEATKKALEVIEFSHKALLENISRNITQLTAKLDSFLTRFGS